MTTKLFATISGYALSFVLFWLLLGAREDMGILKEECNTRVAQAAVEAEGAAREALSAAHRRTIEQMEALIQAERSALRAARTETEAARSDAAEANAMIVRLRDAAEESGDETNCLLQPVDPAILDSLRDD